MDRVDYQQIIIQDLINMENKKELNLNPWYQRRSVWSTPQKSYLINTLLEQKPIPAIYIRHSLDLEQGKSIKEVVDGQQRSRAIIDFFKGGFTVNHPNHEKKINFQELSRVEQERFLMTALPAGILLGASDSDVIEIFGRMNSVSKSLNDQERRNALFSGEMKQFCLKQATSRLPLWRGTKLFSAIDISRMNEVLFISDVVYNLINGLSDFTPAKISKMYEEFDEEFKDKKTITAKLDRALDAIASLEENLISDSIFSRSPLMFSLILAIDSTKGRISIKKLSTAISDIDSRFNDDDNRTKGDQEFKIACASTTQRIASRKIRHNYITQFI